MSSEARPLSKKQRDELASYISLSTRTMRAVLFIVFVAVTAWLFKGLQSLISVGWPVWIVPTAAAAAFVFARSRRWTGGPAFYRAVREDLETGVLNVTVIKPRTVIEVEELEDEGPTYFVRTQDDLVVVFSGQEMIPFRSRGFPWSEFVVEEAPRSGVFFKLQRIGEPVPVDRVIEPLPFETMKALGCFDSPFAVLVEDQELPFEWEI